MEILFIKNKEDLKNRTKENLADNDILIKISLDLYKELLEDEEFYENEHNSDIAVRCPICGCSSFLGNRNYIVKLTVTDGGEAVVYDIDEGGETDREICCDYCGFEYKLNN